MTDELEYLRRFYDARMLAETTFVEWFIGALPKHHAKGTKYEPSSYDPGHPDLRIVMHPHQGVPAWSFPIECKVHRGGRIGLEPSQVAWHVRESRAGNPSFVLAADVLTSKIRLWPGAQTTIVRLALEPASRVQALLEWTWAPEIRKRDVASIAGKLLSHCDAYCTMLASRSRVAPRA
jgi:hypothetical protein